LNGRNYAQLALLGTGIAAAEPGSRVETTYGFSANGARSLQNNFLLDGIDNNANLGDVLNGAAYVSSLPWMPSPNSRSRPIPTAPNSAAATAPS
jgi:hypothetical protein